VLRNIAMKRRARTLAAALAQEIGCSERFVTMINRAALLHDVGKIGLPDAILRKPGTLTPEEYEEVKKHTTIGASLLRPLASQRKELKLVAMAETIALTHHERWDGTGYPQGIKGRAIRLAGRIVAVVDVFDALTHARTYKPGWPIEEAMRDIERQAGTQFDPACVAAFLRVHHAEHR
jgi:putative two-component system response regulator